MYITITKVFRDRLSFNQVVSLPVTDTSENRATRHNVGFTRIARRRWHSGPDDKVILWSNGCQTEQVRYLK